MNTDQIKLLIDKYFDGELEKNLEPLLFTSLSSDEEAREHFLHMNRTRFAIHESDSEFPQSLEQRILYSIEGAAQREFVFIPQKKLPLFFSYSLAVLLLIASLFFYSQTIEYRQDLNSTMVKVRQQDNLIEMLMNSLPEAEVIRERDNEIIIKANI